MSEEGKRTAFKIAVFGVKSIIKLAVYIAIAYLVIEICKSAFSFGYAVFYQKPVAENYGKEITVEIPEEASASDIGKILEEAGLIRDSRVFVLQEFFSNYHDKIQPGTYVLNTEQTADEMIVIMGSEAESEKD